MLTALADGVWLDTGPVSFLGLRLTSNMTVLRMPDGTLVLHSPLPMTPERRAAVVALGTVAHLYAPNTFHHQWIGEWKAAFPAAKLHAPSGLTKKRPDLTIDRKHDVDVEPGFAGVLEEIRIAGFMLEETALVHAPGRTLVVADIVHNIGRPEHGWTAAYTKTFGFYDRVAISKVIRWTAFPDKKAARRAVDSVLAHRFDRMIVGHGAPVTTAPNDALAAAYEWMAR